MSATYTLLSQSETISIPFPIRKQKEHPSLLGGFSSTRPNKQPTKCNNIQPGRVRGIVGADPGELSIRASMARKKAFEAESFENGDFGADSDLDDINEEDEKEMEELIFLMGYECQDLLGEEEKRKTKDLQPRAEGQERLGKKKSFATRLLSRGA
ncbi:MAG: hypothetical protein Q9182_000134 [Xanthomendoza sp. 2 TL-2023]